MLHCTLWGEILSDKYIEEFLDFSSKLDAITSSQGEMICLAKEIVETQNNSAIIKFLQKNQKLLRDSSLTKEVRTIISATHISLLKLLGHQQVEALVHTKEDDDTRTLEELLEELESMVGLVSVKEKVKSLIAFQKVQKLRGENNLTQVQGTLHLAFTGNPGSGKTTVARIVGRIYKRLGLLSRGHFTEVSRTDLIAGYQGQTALKVKAVIERAKGGVLFIDEAYSITENQQNDSYGRECLTELTKALEDYRHDLVVIVAGYTKPMEEFFTSNPGLRSRFNSFIQFDNYSVEELEVILFGLCVKNDYLLSEALTLRLKDYFQKESVDKEEEFSNGRFVRNIYDNLVLCHAIRVATEDNPTKEILTKLTDVDFQP